METLHILGRQLWDRIERSTELVEQRLRRAVGVLEEAGIPYAVVGGNAVRIWVAQVQPGAVRATNDVDILVRPADLERLKRSMLEAGLFHRQTLDLDMFVENEAESPRNAVHIVLSGQMIRSDDYESNPDVEPYEYGNEFRTLPLEGLVRMKLNSFRLKDRVHLLDMIQVGLIDASWCERYPELLRRRLEELIQNPNQ